MAVGVVAAEGQERHYGGRVTAFVVLSCMTAGMGGVIFGYDIGIAGGVSSMEPFLRKFFPDVYRRMRGDTRVSNYCKFDSQLLTAFTSSLYVAGLLTTFLASRVTAGCGRRASMVLGGAAFLAGAAVGGAATASAHFSFHSSIVMCCCRHSRLQNAVSPLRAEQENSLRHHTHTHKLLQLFFFFFFFFSDP